MPMNTPLPNENPAPPTPPAEAVPESAPPQAPQPLPDAMPALAEPPPPPAVPATPRPSLPREQNGCGCAFLAVFYWVMLSGFFLGLCALIFPRGDLGFP